MASPDFSMNVVHFTKGAAPISAAQHPEEVATIVPLTAKQRLFRLLTDGVIRATRMPWTNRRAVCFTECTWPSLLTHAARYSAYGVGFRKEFLFLTGGGPAIYLPPHLWDRQRQHVPDGTDPFAPELFAFLTAFAPPYAPVGYREQWWNGRAPVDYSHEREWRVPHDLAFTLDRIMFVLVDTYEDMAQAPAPLKDAIGRENWIIMSNYRKIEELWPQHQVP